MAATQPAPARDLFNQALPVQRGDDVSDLKYKRGYIPKTYGPEEIAEARRIIAHWNEHFQRTPGGYRANRMDACNVKAYVRFKRHCQASDGEFPFGEKETCKAITRYRQNPQNMKLKSWKRFRDWIDVENVDRFLGADRVAQHAVDHKAAAKADSAKRKAFALQIIRHRNVVAAAERAVQSGSTLEARCGESQRQAEKESGAWKWCARTRGFIASLKAMDAEQQAAYLNRAEEVYRVAYGESPGCQVLAPARLQAIQIVLLDFDVRKHQRNTASAPNGRRSK